MRNIACLVSVFWVLAGWQSAALAQLKQVAFEKSDQKDNIENMPVTNSLGMKLMRIRQGEFVMGSEELRSEKPVHKVRITKDFYLAAHVVTIGQFRTFVKETGYKTEAETSGKGLTGFDGQTRWFSSKPEFNWQKPGFEQADDHPVVCVSANDADAFCKWLSQKEGNSYRLPTEAEFEYAARAGTTTRFSSGDEDASLREIANCADQALLAKMDNKIVGMNGAPPGNTSGGVAAWDDGYSFTSPVGKFKPNPWGLYDMHGNVWTWCGDWSGGYQSGPQDDPALTTPAGGRCIRGGAWFVGPLRCRSANRVQRASDESFCYVGFRVARNAD